jgi:hypothetical protein
MEKKTFLLKRVNFLLQDELEKMQRALNQSYADRDKLALEADKIRDDLERSQVECIF